jgi:hypothetical protein
VITTNYQHKRGQDKMSRMEEPPNLEFHADLNTNTESIFPNWPIMQGGRNNFNLPG